MGGAGRARGKTIEVRTEVVRATVIWSAAVGVNAHSWLWSFASGVCALSPRRVYKMDIVFDYLSRLHTLSNPCVVLTPPFAPHHTHEYPFAPETCDHGKRRTWAKDFGQALSICPQQLQRSVCLLICTVPGIPYALAAYLRLSHHLGKRIMP